MFTSLEQFLNLWAFESAATQRVLDTLTDESLSLEITPDDRTLGRVAWHIVLTVPELISRTGLAFEDFDEQMPVPKSAKTIADYYRDLSSTLVKSIKAQWKDSTLEEDREIYGELWTVGSTLLSIVTHQIHHRGQLTVLMRQAKLAVPGIYGPSREEWSQFGVEAPLV